jgi:hypothetical protein
MSNSGLACFAFSYIHPQYLFLFTKKHPKYIFSNFILTGVGKKDVISSHNRSAKVKQSAFEAGGILMNSESVSPYNTDMS